MALAKTGGWGCGNRGRGLRRVRPSSFPPLSLWPLAARPLPLPLGLPWLEGKGRGIHASAQDKKVCLLRLGRGPPPSLPMRIDSGVLVRIILMSPVSFLHYVQCLCARAAGQDVR